MLHNPPTHPPPVSLRVDRSKGIYAFYNHEKMYLGSFTVPHVLKYLTDPFGVELFDKLKADKYTEAKRLIEKYLVRWEKKSPVLVSHKESPFMGNIEVLARFNQTLAEYEKRELGPKLGALASPLRKKLEMTIKHFIQRLLSHTLKVIMFVSHKIANDPTKEILKKNLLGYTIGLMYRLSQFSQQQLYTQVQRTLALQKDLTLLKESREQIGKKLDALRTALQKELGSPSSPEAESEFSAIHS